MNTCHGHRFQPSQPPVRLLIVEDNRDWLSLLATLLPTHSEGMTVAGAFPHAPTAAELLAARPDVALLDVIGCDGLEAARQVRRLFPWCGVVFLTAYLLHPSVAEAPNKIPGAILLPKPTRIEDLVRVILRLSREQTDTALPTDAGGLPHSRVVRNRDLLVNQPPPPGVQENLWRRVARLTARELECGYLRAQGHSNREIADRLSLSEKRVRNLVSQLLHKTGCRSLAECVQLLHRAGVLGRDAVPPIAE